MERNKKMEKSTTSEILERARAAKREVGALSQDKINSTLLAMAARLEEGCDEVLRANALDLESASGKVSEVMLDRLRLTKDRVCAMAEGIRAIAALPSPVGSVLSRTVREDGLVIEKISVPIGVVAIIYESRPNVTSDAAALTFKSGNVAVLRSGKEAHRTSAVVTRLLREGLTSEGVSPDAIQLVEDTDRRSAEELMRAEGYVDLLIPRGGRGLIRACVENATVPCIETGTGICHVYVDAEADVEKALRIIENAKTSRPSVCNAAEVLLVHRDAAEQILPKIRYILTEKRASLGLIPVELRLDPEAGKIILGTTASAEDFDTEFLDYILAVRVVDSLKQAIEHISRHSTHHSDCIVTENKRTAREFVSAIDSAAVYVNASTRFTDGGEFGLGCEMGISTQKLHARGPMGINELTTYKYVVTGDGHIR